MAYLYRERRYFCGNYLEVDIFPVFKHARGRRSKYKPTSEVQQKLNEHNATQKLIRILNANFSSDDLEIHLTFDDENLPKTPDEAARDVQNFLRRVKRMRKKLGLDDLKYVCVTEGGSNGTRYHYHITLNGGIDRDELEKLWGFGYANSRRLQFNENGIEGLARYITKQFREKKAEILFKKRWTASKNLIIPPPKDRDGKISAKRVREIAESEVFEQWKIERLYPGYEFASGSSFHNDRNNGFYLCLRLYRKASAFDNRKRKKGR